MPVKELMTWSADQRRWFKKINGKMQAVSCRQLGTKPTREASRHAANEWCEAKLKQLESQPVAPPNHWSKRRQELADLMRDHGDIEAAKEIESKSNAQIKDDFIQTLADNIVAHKLGINLERIENTAIIRDRKAKDVTKDRQIGTHIRELLAHKEAQAKSKKKILSVGRWAADKRHLAIFQDWAGQSTAIDAINTTMVRDYYNYVLANDEWANTYQKTVFSTFRTFVRHLGEQELIPLPGNLNSKLFSFGSNNQKIKYFEVEELQQLLDKATEPTKLYLLLMMNCGMYQSDISDLLHDEVDWKAGRITRKRSKTDKHENAPTVTWKLWKATFALLKKYRSNDPNLVLITEKGKPLKQESIIDGKLSKSDNIQSAYRRLQNVLKLPTKSRKPLIRIRKTSANILEKHKEYGRYAQHFLAKAPRSDTAKSYVTPDQPIFDEAVEWLCEQYGIA